MKSIRKALLAGILLVAAGVSALTGWLSSENEWAEVIIILLMAALSKMPP